MAFEFKQNVLEIKTLNEFNEFVSRKDEYGILLPKVVGVFPQNGSSSNGPYQNVSVDQKGAMVLYKKMISLYAGNQASAISIMTNESLIQEVMMSSGRDFFPIKNVTWSALAYGRNISEPVYLQNFQTLGQSISYLATDFLTELRNDNLPQISGSRKLIAGLLVDYIRDTNLSTSLNALKSLERKHRDIFFIWSDYMISKEKAQKLGVKNKYVIRPPSWLVIYNKRSFMMPPDYILGEESCIQFVHDVINKTQEEFKLKYFQPEANINLVKSLKDKHATFFVGRRLDELLPSFNGEPLNADNQHTSFFLFLFSARSMDQESIQNLMIMGIFSEKLADIEYRGPPVMISDTFLNGNFNLSWKISRFPTLIYVYECETGLCLTEFQEKLTVLSVSKFVEEKSGHKLTRKNEL